MTTSDPSNEASPSEKPRKATAYWDYIRVKEVLNLQGGLEESDKALGNDEVLFITVHQIDELWFKLILRELTAMRDLFAQEHVPEQALSSVVRGLKRTEVLFHQTAQHFALMETMTTRDYLGFRDKLSPASGFQSAQMREIEIVLGLDDSRRISLGHEGDYKKALREADGSPSDASRRVDARLADGITIREAVDAWLYRTPIHGSMPSSDGDAETVAAFCESYLDAHRSETERASRYAQHDALTPEDSERLKRRYEGARQSAREFLFAEDLPEGPARARRSRIRAALLFVESYRELPLLAWPREVIDSLVSLEQSVVIFRQRHARMVERMIGRRTGTGGSAGVDYLDQTALKYRVFEDCWAIRTLQIRAEALPELKDPGFYGLVSES